MATPVRGRSSRAVQAEQTRQQILDTAQRLFADLGYDATSLQMIADEMGLTKAAVYYHFRAKSDLLHAAMIPGLERIEILLDTVATLRGRRARAEHLVNGLVEFLVDNRQYAVMAANDPAAKRHNLDEESERLRLRALTLLFGNTPTGAERVAFYAVLSIVETLPELVDLPDDELRDALQTTMLRVLRVPPGVG
ncbi:MAG: gamma-butyrolactone autoregulator receptor [Pseudonocardiales bacterium]|jgi:AcrR family transcriptional regulator|nr:gamma-butyrolactone autoregulator receptor [Pseudonocardiales bacterium]